MHRQKLLPIQISISLMLFAYFPTLNYAQKNFERTYGSSGDDIGNYVLQALDGWYIITGSTESFSTSSRYDIFLMKTGIKGDTLWIRTYGGANNDYGNCVQQTSDGGYIIAGSTGSFGTGGLDVYLIKTDSNGNEMWAHTYGSSYDDEGYSVQQTADGGYIIAVYTETSGLDMSLEDFILIKTDSLGKESWTKTYGGSSYDYCWSVQVCHDGGYTAAGYTNSFGAGKHDAYLVRTDANGKKLWSKAYGDNRSNNSYCVQQTADKGFILAGATVVFFDWPDWDQDVYLIKTDSNGDKMWTVNHGGAGIDNASFVRQTTDGGYIIAGSTTSFGAGETDIYLIKTDSGGAEQWVQTYGTINYEVAHCVQQTADGGYVIVGTTRPSPSGDADIYLIKTDSMGKLTGIQSEFSHSSPSGYTLWTNYPNPFNSSTKIMYTLPQYSYIEVHILDLLGRQVRTLMAEGQFAGTHQVTWNGLDDADKRVTSGVYLYSLAAEGYTETKKLLLLK